MATGYGIYSETTYTLNTDNMAVSEIDWIPALLTERPDLPQQHPEAWNRPLIWGDKFGQVPDTFLLDGVRDDNTDAGILYGEFADDKFTVYMDSDMTLDVGEVDENGFTALNDSGLSEASGFEWTWPESIIADDGVRVKFTTLEIELGKLREEAADAIIKELCAHPENPYRKPEYIKRIDDNTQFEAAEIYAALWIFFRRQADGQEADAKSVMARMYQQMLTEEMARPIAWDMSISITEDDTNVKMSGGGGYIAVNFF